MNGDKILVRKKKIVDEIMLVALKYCEEHNNRVYGPNDKKRIRQKINNILRKDFMWSFGFIYPGCDFIAVTKNISLGQNELHHSITTISHEFIHLVVAEQTDITTSRALDKPTRGKNCKLNQTGSILKRLEKEGYLGGEQIEQ